MNISVFYLVHRFFYRFFKFIYNWYIATFFAFSEYFTNFLESLDKTWALKITARNFFRPLYQDRTILGYILGIFFRFWRLLIGGAIYLVIILIGIAIYLIWAAVPLYIIYKSIL